jgi:hypothetical protein
MAGRHTPKAITSAEIAMHFNLLIPDKAKTSVVVCVKSMQAAGDAAMFDHFRKQGNIEFFGVHDQVVSVDAITSTDMDMLAKILYDTYRNEWAPDDPPWERISYAAKEPNREAADHMDVKKGMLERLTGTVCAFRQKFTIEDTIGSHAFAPLEALACV